LFNHITRVLATNEMTLGTSGLQRVGQRQATHDMADTDLQGSVGADGYFQFWLFSRICGCPSGPRIMLTDCGQT
jgi:hypothetical protein